MDMIDFDDLPEGDLPVEVKLINTTIKLPEDVRTMFSKIATRERRNVSGLGAIVIEDYVKNYIEEYKKG